MLNTDKICRLCSFPALKFRQENDFNISFTR